MARKITESIRHTIQEAVQAIDLTPIDADEAQSNLTQDALKCGAVLRASREEQNLTIQEVATRLRLSAKQIEALEADKFTALPEPTIVRGFIRNYAKQLKIAPEPLLQAYSVMVPSSVPHEMIVKPTANMKMTSYKKPNTGLYSLAALVILLGLSIWLFYQNYVQKPNPTKEITHIGNVEPLPLPEPALPAAERQAGLQAATEIALPPAQDTASASAPKTDSSASDPSIASASTKESSASESTITAINQPLPAAKTQTAPTAVVPNTALPAPEVVAASATNMARLEFSATQETWVNIIDGNGQEVYSKTIFAGSREAISAKLPVNITVGNAGATSLNMNGKSYDLAPYSRNNVAHIKLEK